MEIFRVGNILGEGILWDSRRAALWWTDIQGRKLHRYDWSSGKIQVLDAPERIGSFGLVADSEDLIAAFATGIARYHPHQQTVTWLARPAAVTPGIRFNDGRVDRRGRFWCGTMVEGKHPALSGALYSIGAAQELRCHLEGVQISNSLCMSPDGTQLYFADSPTRTIGAYELHEPEGILGKHRIFAQTPDGAFPDGFAVFYQPVNRDSTYTTPQGFGGDCSGRESLQRGNKADGGYSGVFGAGNCGRALWRAGWRYLARHRGCL